MQRGWTLGARAPLTLPAPVQYIYPTVLLTVQESLVSRSAVVNVFLLDFS